MHLNSFGGDVQGDMCLYTHDFVSRVQVVAGAMTRSSYPAKVACRTTFLSLLSLSLSLPGRFAFAR